MEQRHIDGGKAFDWGKASEDYAKYRDIYPPEFYAYLRERDIGVPGQRVLDIGTGTGVLPRALYHPGVSFTGADISREQIAQAERLAREGGMDIRFLCVPAEEMAFAPGSFDVVTACQCFAYFNHTVLAPKLSELLDEDGRFVVLYMAWLPEEDSIAGQSEKLVLQYNPAWTGCGETRRAIAVPQAYQTYFKVEETALFDVQVAFTRESWNGRMKACRGVGPSLTPAETARFEQEHRQLLARIAPEEFTVLHYVAAAVLRKK